MNKDSIFLFMGHVLSNFFGILKHLQLQAHSKWSYPHTLLLFCLKHLYRPALTSITLLCHYVTQRHFELRKNKCNLSSFFLQNHRPLPDKLYRFFMLQV